MRAGYKYLDMNDCEVKHPDIQPIAAALTLNNYFTSISMRERHQPNAVDSFADVVAKNSTLTKLTLSNLDATDVLLLLAMRLPVIFSIFARVLPS